VPAYAVKPGGALEGLTSVTQLDHYADALGNKFYDADPGYITTEQNARRLAGYGITRLEHVVSSEAAELRSWGTPTAARSRSCCTCTTRTRRSPSTTWCSSMSPRPTPTGA
jgi:hypothetical protein